MTWVIHHHDVQVMPWPIEDSSVQCVVTSPPYWGLRDYGTARWDGGSGDCDHLEPASGRTQNKGNNGRFGSPYRDICRKCGARRIDSQLGLERTFDEYVEKMVAVFREVRRVLRKDGTLWLNLGDCYATGAGKVGEHPGGGERGERWKAAATNTIDGKARKGIGPMTQPNRMPQSGLKPKDLVGIPWRVAFALQADGWWLRSDIVWAKPNPMPESITDRPTKAHEYVFLLTKSARYYYDHDAIRTPSSGVPKMPDGWATHQGAHGSFHRNGREKGARTDKQRGHSRPHAGFNNRWDKMDRAEQQANGANARTVWQIATEPYAEAHFATFPTELARRCILAGSRPGDLVLDPFAGSGTTLLVADMLGRDGVGLELNPEYVSMAERRIRVPRTEAGKERAAMEDLGQRRLFE